jgi:SP family galactose:H+ symporter-like MFS transporter
MSDSTPQTAGVSDSQGEGAQVPITKWLFLVGAVILTAGLLFGYDQGVISGALVGIEKSFSVSTFMVEIITSWVTLGALAGALAAGILSDKIGRKSAVLLAAVLFGFGALIEAFAPGAWVLVAGRLIVGFGVGVASVAAPLYAAEMAPTRMRGRFVSGYQFGITFGIFLAYLIDELLSSGDRWRLMLGISAVPAVLLVAFILPSSDTPRWFLTKGRRDEARAALARIRPDDTDAAMDELEASVDDETEQASWAVVFSRTWRRPLTIGIGLAVFQQVTGINAIIYYANKIFAAAGFVTPEGQTAATTWAIGAVNVLATLIAIAFVDKLGRKPLLKAGLVGMSVSLTVVGICFWFINRSGPSTSGGPSDAGLITLVALVVYIASFAFSLGPVVWTVINEIFPRSIRGRGVSIATAANWGSAWLVSQFFLSLVSTIGESGTFLLFAALSVAAFIWISKVLPETRGRSLEDIEQMWLDEPGQATATAT